MPRAQLDAERTENGNLRQLLEATVPVARYQALEDDVARLRREVAAYPDEGGEQPSITCLSREAISHARIRIGGARESLTAHSSHASILSTSINCA